MNRFIGRPRNAVMETVGGRRFSQQEINACRAAIPKFQDPRETVVAKAHKFGDVNIFFCYDQFIIFNAIYF